MSTKNYERTLPSGRVLAKRGYVYFLYNTMEALKADDDNAAKNLERLRRGEYIFNRAELGSWIFVSGWRKDIVEYDRNLCVAKEALHGN